MLRVKRADPIAAEIIVRRYITGSLWRAYQRGEAGVYEVPLAADLQADQRFETPIITPSTKAAVGEHDEPISRRGLVEEAMSKALLDEACEKAMQLFLRGEELAAAQGLILVDTKYEFGMIDGELCVIDEIPQRTQADTGSLMNTRRVSLRVSPNACSTKRTSANG